MSKSKNKKLENFSKNLKKSIDIYAPMAYNKDTTKGKQPHRMKGSKTMYRVSYISNNSISNKSGFKTEEAAREWINNTANIKPLKLLVWDNDIDCCSTVETFNNRENATATTFYKRVYA